MINDICGLCPKFLRWSFKTLGISSVIGAFLLFMVGFWVHTSIHTNELTPGGPPDTFKMGAGPARKTSYGVRGLGL